MPRYLFDTDDGERQIRDTDGIDLLSSDDIQATARDLLFDLGHAEILNETDLVFNVAMRNEQGATVYRGSMVLRIEFQA